MASSLPPWWGRERGTSLSSVIALEEAQVAGPGLLEQLGDRLFGGIGDLPSGVAGFFVPFLALTGATAAATAASPGLVALLAPALLVWTALCGAAAWQVWQEGEGAPAWAKGLAGVLVVFGRVVIVVAIVATVVAVVIALLSIVAAASASER